MLRLSLAHCKGVGMALDSEGVVQMLPGGLSAGPQGDTPVSSTGYMVRDIHLCLQARMSDESQLAPHPRL